MSEQKQVPLTQFSSTATPSDITWLEPLLGLLAGTLGGIVESRILEGSAAHEILLGALFGLAFGLFFAKRATTPGAGLIWGSSAAFLFWVAVHAGATLWFTKAAHSPEMLPRLRQHFDDLVSYVVCLGMPVGVLLGIRGSLRPSRERIPFHWARGIVVGAFSGLLGGFIFGTRRSAGDFFPLLAGMGVIHSHGTNVFLHFCVAVVIGSAFGLLFQRDVFGFGSSMGWASATRFSGGFSARSPCCRSLQATSLIGPPTRAAPSSALS